MQGQERVLILRLQALEGPGRLIARPGDRTMEFHISRKARQELGLDRTLFSSTGNVIFADFRAARELARRFNQAAGVAPERLIKAGQLNAMALIDEILHDVARLFREQAEAEALKKALTALESALGKAQLDALLAAFAQHFPSREVYEGRQSCDDWLADFSESGTVSNRELALEELILLRLANENPAFGPFSFLFDERLLADSGAKIAEAYEEAISILEASFKGMSDFGPDCQDLLTMLRSPAVAAPYSLPGQLDYIRRRWGLLLGDKLRKLLGSLDLIKEEEKPRFSGPGPTRAYAYSGMEKEYERFSPDADWMPNVVMMAKSALVWLSQLSKNYGRDIRTLDAIPDEELDSLAWRGFNALWLIGIWERSAASAEIKRRCGNPEAAASAYSLFDYDIAGELGGWAALESLRGRCAMRGIRLAADMVPNHTGIDSAWVRERPGLFIQSDVCPFPSYTFNGPDLSGDSRVGIWLEDHYFTRSDAAVVFKRLDRQSGQVSYIYHGNDGTGLPWSDTAQIDFLKRESREAVKERILHVAKNFPIIRFDAAMIMARKHFRRLWYPEPGSGGDIASRSDRALSGEDFERAMPEEFWREVVDLCAKEAPDTLLLAEAFWMMEGYFVRTLGMHRVYNSAFMNMLKKEENGKYKETIRNTQEFDKDILKRFVNFMNNPDEETAVAQFGRGDKYFGVCTLMATMPGLPMFGHGQLEGFEEKYGMEYRRAYRDEIPDQSLIERHEREIFPLLKRRRLFSGVERFLLFDLIGPGGVNDNVFAYANGDGGERALVVYNNAYARAEGFIRESCPFAEKLPGGGKSMQKADLARALGLKDGGYSSGSPRYCVMREQRSELWYIRRSRELAESGLKLILDGYQSQVFLDIFEVEDDENGLYTAVYDALGGRGTADFSAAVQDIALKDLYSLYWALARPLVSWAGSLRLPEASRRGINAAEKEAKPRQSAASFAKSLEAPAQAFFEKTRELMRQEAAEEGLPGDRKGKLAAKTKKPSCPSPEILAKHDAAAVKAAVRRLSSSIAALGSLAKDAGAAVKKTKAGSAEKSDKSRIGGYLSQIADAPGAFEEAAAFILMDALSALCAPPLGRIGEEEALAARRVIERYYLDRKLREELREVGMCGNDAYHCLALSKILLPRLAAWDPEDEEAAEKKTLLESFTVWMEENEELRAILGVNVYGGVTWFNKERFEATIRQCSLLASLRYPKARQGILESAISSIIEAEEAGYSLEKLAVQQR